MTNISTSIHGRVAVIRLQGRFNIKASETFREASRTLAAASGPEEIEVDLGEVDDIDSTAPLGRDSLAPRGAICHRTWLPADLA
jgi:anti-anti-sigma regulatory factor